MASIKQRLVCGPLEKEQLFATCDKLVANAKHWHGGGKLNGGKFKQKFDTVAPIRSMKVPQVVSFTGFEVWRHRIDEESVEDALATLHRHIDGGMMSEDHDGIYEIQFHWSQVPLPIGEERFDARRMTFLWTNDTRGATGVNPYWSKLDKPLQDVLDFHKLWAERLGGKLTILDPDKDSFIIESSWPTGGKRAYEFPATPPSWEVPAAELPDLVRKTFRIIRDEEGPLFWHAMKIGFDCGTWDKKNQAEFYARSLQWMPEGWDSYQPFFFFGVGGMEDFEFALSALGKEQPSITVQLGSFAHPADDDPHPDLMAEGEINALATLKGLYLAVDLVNGPLPEKLAALFPLPLQEVLPGCVPGFSKGKAQKKTVAKKKRTK